MIPNGGHDKAPKLDAMQYRPDVDGLRAVAVLLVIAHHVKLPLFSGGFVGVDIFFAISGFLIINQIAGGIARNRFSFGEFWARRALRILPPYLLVIIASLIAANFILATDEEFEEFGEQVVYSALMVVNHLFLSEQGYFDTSAELKPLLHLWSLAVEEQFYLFAPILLVGLSWLGTRVASGRILVTAILIALAGISLVLCIWLTGVADNKNYAFYLMPLRMWEFTAGGMIASIAPLVRRLPRRFVDCMGLAGFALIGFAMTQFTAKTPFPGSAAVIPVLGASAVILAGMVHPLAWVSRLLSVPLLVGIGLVSYSWYLWHWPLLTFTRIYNFGHRDVVLDALIGGVLSLGLAVLTYHFVEKPVRAWGRRSMGLHAWRLAFFGATACAIVAVAGPLQADSASGVQISIPEQPSVSSPGCILRSSETAEPCIDAADGRPTGVIIGDSHGSAAYPVLSDFAEKQGRFLANSAFNGCSPLFGVGLVAKANSARCAPWHENAVELIADIRPQFAIFAAQWQFHVRDNAAMWEDEREPNQRDFFVASVRRAISTLKSSGVKRVLIIAPVPLWRRSAPQCLAHWLKHGRDPVGPCGWSYTKVHSNRAKSVEWLEEAVAGMEGVRLADPIEALCTEERCRPYDGTSLLYTDHSHLSSEGVRLLLADIEEDVRWVMDIPGQVAGQP